jgi:hypothetical protein
MCQRYFVRLHRFGAIFAVSIYLQLGNHGRSAGPEIEAIWLICVLLIRPFGFAIVACKVASSIGYLSSARRLVLAPLGYKSPVAGVSAHPPPLSAHLAG